MPVVEKSELAFKNSGGEIAGCVVGLPLPCTCWARRRASYRAWLRAALRSARRVRSRREKEHVTVWTILAASTEYIPATPPLMVNYIVDDLDTLGRRKINFTDWAQWCNSISVV